MPPTPRQRDWVRRVLGIGDAAPAAGVSVLSRKLQIRWREAQRQAEDSLAQLGTALLSRPDVQADPLFGQVREVVGRLTEVLPASGEALASHLDALVGAGEHSARELAGVLAAISGYRQDLAGVPELAELEAFGQAELGGTFPIASALEDAVGQLEDELQRLNAATA